MLENGKLTKPIVYIISSLKNPAEYEVLRHIYRRNFILLSIYEDKESRKDNLLTKEVNSLKGLDREIVLNKLDKDVQALMDSDETELDVDNNEMKWARSTINTYHRSHYFIHKKQYVEDINRFVSLLFNAPVITPTREEQGMAMAYILSLRSADPSRQVGAVIIDDDGNILSSGCNEVPKFGGGLHWHDTKPDLRDYNVCDDGDTLTKIIKERVVDEVISKISMDVDDGDKRKLSGVVKDSLDFIRAVHAEEAAICDAAKRGISILGSTICVTTFPCHLCMKHIIAAGIKKVIYIEPYPKSQSEELYKDIVKDKASIFDDNMVKLTPFNGVSPKRYKYVFNKMKVDRQRDGKIIKDINNINRSPKYISHSTPIGYFWVEVLYRGVLLKEYPCFIKQASDKDINDLELFNKVKDVYSDHEIVK